MNGGREIRFYCDVLKLFEEFRVPFLVGGAFAFGRYTGIERDTKDLDLFVRPEDAVPAIEKFKKAGYAAEIYFTHWLGKIYQEDRFVDVIFDSGNGLCPVDDEWFRYSVKDRVWGIPVRLCAPEEMIWQKAFIMERHRYDGADIAHILRHKAPGMNWPRLFGRFGNHWRVLLSHLILFGFIYPGERDKIPSWVMKELTARLDSETGHPPSPEPYCQGTFLSLLEYLFDLEKGQYRDPRLAPRGPLSREEVERFTRAFTH